MIEVKESSWHFGNCDTCPHLKVLSAEPYCNVKRPCGQAMACKCQARAIVVGRQPCGRVRKKPLQRVMDKAKRPIKISAVEYRHAFMRDVGEEHGIVWVNELTPSQQTIARKLVKQGKIPAYYVAHCVFRGKPHLFIKMKDLKRFYRTWEQWTGK